MKNKDRKQMFFQEVKKANHKTICWKSLQLTAEQWKTLNHIMHMKIIRMVMLGGAFGFFVVILTMILSIRTMEEKLMVILLWIMSVIFFFYAIYLLLWVRIRPNMKGLAGKASNVFFLKNEGRRLYYITMVMEDGQVLEKMRIPYQFRNVNENDEMILVAITKHDWICIPKNVNN